MKTEIEILHDILNFDSVHEAREVQLHIHYLGRENDLSVVTCSVSEQTFSKCSREISLETNLRNDGGQD